MRTTGEVGRIRVVKTESKGKGNKRIRMEILDGSEAAVNDVACRRGRDQRGSRWSGRVPATKQRSVRGAAMKAGGGSKGQRAVGGRRLRRRPRTERLNEVGGHDDGPAPSPSAAWVPARARGDLVDGPGQRQPHTAGSVAPVADRLAQVGGGRRVEGRVLQTSR